MLGPDSHGHADHAALLYDDPGGFVGPAARFVRDGARAGEHVLVAVGEEKVGWLRDELGDDLDVEYAGAEQFYGRLGPMFASLQDLVRRHAGPGARGLRLVAEHAIADRAPAHRRAYMRYEAASNLVYRGHAASVMCAYDAGAVPDEVLDDAVRSHPWLAGEDGRRPSERFVDPAAFVAGASQPAGAPAARPIDFERPDDVAALRRAVERDARAAGLEDQACEDLVLAASEIATNALRHGRAPRCLTCFVDDGDLVCQVTDGGPGPADPLAGFFAPSGDSVGGFGLWISNQACDVVELSGGTVALRVRLPDR